MQNAVIQSRSCTSWAWAVTQARLCGSLGCPCHVFDSSLSSCLSTREHLTPPTSGGALAHAVGPAHTCFVVGGAIGASALLAHRLVPETRGIHEIGEIGQVETQSAGEVVRELWTTWNSETSHELRCLCVANLAFFATIAGANMTVLPLVLTCVEINRCVGCTR